MRDIHTLPDALRADLDRAGYYPELVFDVLDVSVAGEPVVAHLVHAETTFDQDVVRRHITTFVLTATRLVVTRNTVKSQVHSVYRKIGASTRAEAVAWAQGHGVR